MYVLKYAKKLTNLSPEMASSEVAYIIKKKNFTVKYDSSKLLLKLHYEIILRCVGRLNKFRLFAIHLSKRQLG